MSNIGKTLLRGHALQYEGGLRWDSRGIYSPYGEYAMCQCGELSPRGISRNAAKRWHREHKDSLR